MKEHLEERRKKNQNNKKLNLAGAALGIALTVTPIVVNAENDSTTLENNKNKITAQINETTETGQKGIKSFYEAQTELINKEGKITKEEMRDQIRNLQSEIYKYESRLTTETVIEEILNDEEMNEIIYRLVNREDIVEAALLGDRAYIQKELQKELKDYDDTFYSLLTGSILGIGGLLIMVIKNHYNKKKQKKEDNNKEKNEN